MYQQILQSYNPAVAVTTTVWAIPVSLATTQGITLVFSSSGYLDVSVPRVCLLSDTPITRGGLPHSEIFGSWDACSYPKLIAACHVLRRLQMPRHPPYTLLFFLPTRLLELQSLNFAILLATVHPFHHVKYHRTHAHVARRRVGCYWLQLSLHEGTNHQSTQASPAMNQRVLCGFFCRCLPQVENTGVEPVTSCLQGRRSSQLS